MPAIQPRLTAVVEKPVFKAIEFLAKKDGVSLSQKVRDLLIHALQLEEDVELEALVRERKKNRGSTISLAKVKQRLGIK